MTAAAVRLFTSVALIPKSSPELFWNSQRPLAWTCWISDLLKLLWNTEPVTFASAASTEPGSATFRIGKSLEKSIVVVPRMKFATPSTPAEPNSLSGDDSAVES